MKVDFLVPGDQEYMAYLNLQELFPEAESYRLLILGRNIEIPKIPAEWANFHFGSEEDNGAVAYKAADNTVVLKPRSHEDLALMFISRERKRGYDRIHFQSELNHDLKMPEILKQYHGSDGTGEDDEEPSGIQAFIQSAKSMDGLKVRSVDDIVQEEGVSTICALRLKYGENVYSQFETFRLDGDHLHKFSFTQLDADEAAYEWIQKIDKIEPFEMDLQNPEAVDKEFSQEAADWDEMYESIDEGLGFLASHLSQVDYPYSVVEFDIQLNVPQIEASWKDVHGKEIQNAQLFLPGLGEENHAYEFRFFPKVDPKEVEKKCRERLQQEIKNHLQLASNKIL